MKPVLYYDTTFIYAYSLKIFNYLAQLASPTYQMYSNGVNGSAVNGDLQQPTVTTTMPRIQLLSNNVDNVNYYDDNSQVLAQNSATSTTTTKFVNQLC